MKVEAYNLKDDPAKVHLRLSDVNGHIGLLSGELFLSLTPQEADSIAFHLGSCVQELETIKKEVSA